MVRRVRYRHLVDGVIVETDAVVCRPDEWTDQPESQSEEWSIHTFGRRLLVALRAPLAAIAAKPSHIHWR